MAEHKWCTNGGAGGPAGFTGARQLSIYPIMNVKCKRTGARTYFTQKQWRELPDEQKTEIPKHVDY